MAYSYSSWSIALLLAAVSINGCLAGDRVLLSSVQTVTLRKGAYTTGRRSAPLPQLKCIGGQAYGRFEPDVVQCYNRGSDGVDVQWECKADMDEIYKFGEITVVCEGYDYPDDPYVLKGSCGMLPIVKPTLHSAQLEYTLEYSKKAGYDKSTTMGGSSAISNLIAIGCMLLLAFVIFKTCVGGASDDNTTRRPGGGGGGSDDWRGGPPGPGFRPGYDDPPPPYEEKRSTGHSTGSSAQQQWQPGFFTGMGAGGLMGYLFGRQTGPSAYDPYGNTYARPGGYGGGWGNGLFGGGGRGANTFGPSAHRYDAGDRPSTSAHPAPTGNVRSSSGFGGTRRR